MSDAHAVLVTQNGVPPAAQDAVLETPGFKVFAGNLAYSTTEEGLRAFFEPVEGDILSAQIILRGQRSAGYGFIALATEDAARKAVEALNKKELDGRPVIVEIAKPSDQKDQEKKERKTKRRPGRRGGKAVPGEVTEAEADGEAPKAEEPVGTDEAAKPKKKKKKAARKSKAKAESSPAPADGAATSGAEVEAEAIVSDNTTKKTRRTKPKTQRNPRPIGQDPAGEPSKTMLFVANLGFNIDDEGLRALFTDADINVVSSRIVRRRWQPRKSKGYGFVDVGSEEEQKKAITLLDGMDISGRPVAVKVAVNTPVEESSDESKPVEDDASGPAVAA